MTDFKDGDIITVNGKPCRIEAGALVPVVQRGPLGGELKQVSDSTLSPGDVVYLKLTYERHRGELGRLFKDDFGLSCHMDIDGVHFETNIPPRHTFTPMTASEAAKLPDIVGNQLAEIQTECNDMKKCMKKALHLIDFGWKNLSHESIYEAIEILTNCVSKYTPPVVDL